MTISEFTLKSSDVEPARRFEVFTGTGRRDDLRQARGAERILRNYNR